MRSMVQTVLITIHRKSINYQKFDQNFVFLIFKIIFKYIFKWEIATIKAKMIKITN